ncbi:MAG: hypothetical protein MUC88_00385 [Planctomycetes bacterium]|jgi:hypothetical protein|nr:hypothetical protein [Planctomycetota bacterium]
MLTIRIESEAKGGHVHMRVRAGETPGQLALCGLVIMTVGEWQLFGAALLLGAERMCGHLGVELPDQDVVVKALVEQSHAADQDARQREMLLSELASPEAVLR